MGNKDSGFFFYLRLLHSLQQNNLMSWSELSRTRTLSLPQALAL